MGSTFAGRLFHRLCFFQMYRIGIVKMSKNNTTTKIPLTTYASILVAIFGLSGSVLLKKYLLVGEASFISLIVLSIFVALVIYLEPNIQEFSLNLTGISAKLKSVDAILAKETEPQTISDENTKRKSISGKGYSFTPDSSLVMFALGSGKFTWRSLNGIAKDTGLPLVSIEKALESLISSDLAIETQNNEGKLWGLSSDGRSCLPAIIAWKNKQEAKA